MKSKRRISKLLIASLLSYGLSNCGMNNVNVVRAMENDNRLRAQREDERLRLEEEENFNRNYQPPNDLEQRLKRDGLNNVIRGEIRRALSRISRQLQQLLFGGVADDDQRVQDLYDARSRWWGPVCVWDWTNKTNTRYRRIVGKDVFGYDKDGEAEDALVNARPLDGRRRYCGACGNLLNSRFIVAAADGSELPGDMFVNANELEPNGLALGDVKLPCGHIMCVECSHRMILTKRCDDESWGHENGGDGGKLVCPMERNSSPVPGLKTENIPLGEGYWVSAGHSNLNAIGPGLVYGQAIPEAIWADRIQSNFQIPLNEQINDAGRRERAQHQGQGHDVRDRERHEREERERLEREERERLERERAERERAERERAERERAERERAERERAERERLERERREREERERLERERTRMIPAKASSTPQISYSSSISQSIAPATAMAALTSIPTLTMTAPAPTTAPVVSTTVSNTAQVSQASSTSINVLTASTPSATSPTTSINGTTHSVNANHGSPGNGINSPENLPNNDIIAQ